MGETRQIVPVFPLLIKKVTSYRAAVAAAGGRKISQNVLPLPRAASEEVCKVPGEWSHLHTTS